MVDSVRVARKGTIRASTKKLSGRLLENGITNVSAIKLHTLGEYRLKVESVRVPKTCSSGYRKSLESVQLPENGRLRESIGKM